MVKKVINKLFIALVALIALLIVTVGIYVLYVVMGYERINDTVTLEIEETIGTSGVRPLKVGESYTALIFNIGFGAYDHEFSFFMDNGIMADGMPTKGEYSRARSLEAAEQNTLTVAKQAAEQDVDILLFQEVDKKADRSYSINQVNYITKTLGQGYMYNYATNFHTGYLFYPPTKPIGKIEDAGLLTLSRYRIDSAERLSLPVTDAFPDKYFDLDRCITVSRMPVAGADADLVLINVHPSAYDEGGVIRTKQMKILAEIMSAEYANNHYVIVGGDFNHAFGGSENLFMNDMQRPAWVQTFDSAMLPKGFQVVLAENNSEVATCRDTSIPYTKGVNYEVVLDGYIVSENVKATATNIDADYLGTDHNPVKLTFTLL